ncbi:TPA: hypothetical protein ACHJ3J_006680, partial [Pseudomonas aeruginosa]
YLLIHLAKLRVCYEFSFPHFLENPSSSGPLNPTKTLRENSKISARSERKLAPHSETGGRSSQ